MKLYLGRPENAELPGLKWSPEFEESLKRSEKERIERYRLEDANPRFVITTVHGTWARNAGWVEPDSGLGVSLRERLAPARIVPFKWSGKNRVKARAGAARELQDRLTKLRKRYPNAHHAIIAHSHGGNVALTALADPDLAASMLGVVTLGTPFLSARLHRPQGLLGLVDGLVAATVSGIAVFFAGMALGHGRGWWIEGLVAFGGITGILALGAWVSDVMRSHASRVCRSMPAPRLESAQLAIVRTPGDEAMATIAGARVTGACVAMFWDAVSGRAVRALRHVLDRVDYLGWRRLDRERQELFDAIDLSSAEDLFANVERARLRLAHSSSQPVRPDNDNSFPSILKRSVLPLVVIYTVILLNTWWPTATRWLAGALTVAYGVPAIGALLLGVAAVPFGIFSALGLLPCGWTLPLAGPYLRFSAEPAPPGTWTVSQVVTENEDGRLSHGRAHDDPAVHSFVGRWLSERAEVAARHTWPMPPPPSVPRGSGRGRGCELSVFRESREGPRTLVE